MDHQSTDNNLFRMKVKGIIDNSLIVLEKKITVINKELQKITNDSLTLTMTLQGHTNATVI